MKRVVLLVSIHFVIQFSFGQTLEQRFSQLDELAKAQNYDQIIAQENQVRPLFENRQDTLAAATASVFAEAHYNKEQYAQAAAYWEQERTLRLALNQRTTA